MNHKPTIAFVVLAGLMMDSGEPQAQSGNAFFGVGLTVLAAKPKSAANVINRSAVYTPGAAAIGLAAQGYTAVALVNRNDTGYLFSAVSRSTGKHYLLTVAAWHGEIVEAVLN